MSKMLNAHPSVGCVERRLFGQYVDIVQDKGKDHPRLRITLDKYIDSLWLHYSLPASAKEALLQSLVTSMVAQEKKSLQKQILVDKITPYIHTAFDVLSGINQFFPRAKILYLLRDGRDVLTSGVFHWFNKQLAGTKLNDFEKERRAIYLGKKNGTLPRFFQDSEIEQWATEWKQPLETIKNAKETHEVMLLRYENLLHDTPGVLSDCLEFLSAKTSPNLIKACVEAGSFKKMSKGREQGCTQANAHVRKGIAGDWKNYFTLRDAQLFHEIAGDKLLELDYEKSEQWVANCKKELDV
jgi:hypothetical protein